MPNSHSGCYSGKTLGNVENNEGNEEGFYYVSTPTAYFSIEEFNGKVDNDKC